MASLDIVGSNATIRNVYVDGNIFVRGDHVTIEHVTTKGIAVSSASDVTIRYANIGHGTEDAIHITSDAGKVVQRVVLEYNYVHDPQVPDSAHYDGTQVRGANTVTIRCSTYDPGPYRPPFNAAIYLENANGGVDNVSIEHNWLTGFGFTFMIDAKETVIDGNVIGPGQRWGICYLGQDVAPGSIAENGNVLAGSLASTKVCDGT